MANISTGSTGIKFGSTLRIGYRPQGSTSSFVYVTPYPTYDQLPKTFSITGPGIFEIEYTEICPNCSGGLFSDPVITQITVP